MATNIENTKESHDSNLTPLGFQDHEENHSVTESASTDATKKGGAVAMGSATAAPSFKEIEVFDAEKGALTQRSEEQQAKARAILQRIKQAEGITWALVCLFVDGKHYLDVGYSSKADFYAAEFNVGANSIQKKLKAGRFLLNLLPANLHEHVDNIHQVEGVTDEQVNNFQALSGMAISKIHALSNIEEADFTETLDTAIVKFADGREVALEEIETRTRNEINNLFKSQIDKYKERNANLLDAKSEHEAEIKRLQQEQAAMSEKIAEAERKELRYGPKEMELMSYYRRVEMANSAVREANKLITTIKIPEDAPDDLMMNVQMLHKIIDGGRQTLFDNNHHAIRGAVETKSTTQWINGDLITEDGEILEEGE